MKTTRLRNEILKKEDNQKEYSKQKPPPEVLYKKVVLKHFTIFTG